MSPAMLHICNGAGIRRISCYPAIREYLEGKMKKINISLLFLITIVLSACIAGQSQLADAVQKTLQAIESPTPFLIKETVNVPVEVTVQVEITRLVEITREVEVTRKVEIPVTVTFTPGPSPTPTNTPTPTPSLTPTPTATPFNISGCTNLQSVPNYWNISTSEYGEKLFPFYEKYNGKCVKFYYKEGLGIIGTDYGWLKLFSKMVTFVVDDMSPEGLTKAPVNYATVWGVWEEKSPGKYEIRIRRVEEYPPLQQPIEDDGFYMVGDEFVISQGQWKSLWPPGIVDNCYWARTNPDNGDIKDNNFGQAGVYVRLYDGDLFESDDCAPWVFVQP
jgi:hypothetical protein